MKSPFIGMNPWLEGYLWPDVHNRLAIIISELLAPVIAPKYVARVEIYTANDDNPSSEIGIMYPDIEILQRIDSVSEPQTTYGENTITLPNTIVPFTVAIPVRIPVIEIRDVAKNKLITAIEILSPVNKRGSGLTQYRKKMSELHRSQVHLLEIDLLRRGTRPFLHPKIQASHYQMMLLRAGVFNADIWTIDVKDPLPTLPIPLRHPDPDVSLNLGKALETIFERGLYYLSVDYNEPPPPPIFDEKDSLWIKTQLERAK
jgi:hypothetical protein